MQFNIRGENIEITEALSEYVKKRVSKLNKYFDGGLDAIVHVKMSVYRTHKIEVTIPLTDVILRAEENKEDMYAAIDLVVDKLERQIRKYKTRLNRKSRKIKTKGTSNHEIKDEHKIVREKHLKLKPMFEEEAILQMEMLGHQFFVFTNAETLKTDILYRKYGLIHTE